MHNGGTICYKAHQAKWGTTLNSVAAKNGNGKRCTSFPAATFERAILSQLIEVKPSEMADDVAPSKIEALDGRLVELDVLIAAWTDKMNNPDIVDVVAAKLADLKAARKELTAERAAAQQEAAAPLKSAWKESARWPRLRNRVTSIRASGFGPRQARHFAYRLPFPPGGPRRAGAACGRKD